MSALVEGGYVTLQKLSLTATVGTSSVPGGGPPGSGATVVLWASNRNNAAAGHGARYKMIVVNVITSADSAANGLTFEESNDGGTTWDVIGTGDSITAVGGYTKTYKKVSAPEVRVRYVNSAAVLTTWRGSVMGDPMERGNG